MHVLFVGITTTDSVIQSVGKTYTKRYVNLKQRGEVVPGF